MVGNPAFCTSAIKGLTTVGFKGPVTAIQQCVDQTSAKATNGGYKGVNVLTTLNSANKEYLQYLAVMKQVRQGCRHRWRRTGRLRVGPRFGGRRCRT